MNPIDCGVSAKKTGVLPRESATCGGPWRSPRLISRDRYRSWRHRMQVVFNPSLIVVSSGYMIHPVECGVDLPSSGTGDDGAIEADNPGGQLWHRQRLIDPNAGRCRVFVGISEWGYHLPVVRFDFEREVW